MSDTLVKNMVKAIKESTDAPEGEVQMTLDNLKDLYKQLERPEAKIVKLQNNIFISFEVSPKLHFLLLGETNLDKLLFIDKSIIINAEDKVQGVFKFIFFELWQGKNVFSKLVRFSMTLVPMILFNVLILIYSSNDNVKDLTSGLLTAISVFVGIFSIFTITHEHWKNKALDNFESGKLAYYFSVDKHITELGVTAIISCLYALLISPSGNNIFYHHPLDIKLILVIFLLNVSFFSTYIILRSLFEFYIPRPAKFILGDLKNQSLNRI